MPNQQTKPLGVGRTAGKVTSALASSGERTIRRSGWLCLALAALVPMACTKPPEPARWIESAGTPASAAAQSTAPDVLMVLVDTLRPDHLGCYGYQRATSPFLDRWSQGALRFEAAFSNATHTRIAIASLFTGARPTVHRVRQVDRLDADSADANAPPTDGVHDRFVTLAEALQAAGYRTWGFSSNPHITHLLGFHQGFEGWWETPSRNGADLLARFEAELDRRPADDPRPLFGYLHFMDVHNPYAPPEPYDTMFAPQQPGKVVYANGPASPSQADLEWSIGQYDGDIRAFDGLLEQLLTRWERPGATARRPRITILLSDHGEEFMEHGGLGHGTTVFREQARIALLLKATSVVPGISGSPVQMIDVSRAVLDFAGAAVPHHFQGRPVALWGQPVSIYTEALHGLFALRCNQLMTTQVSGKPDSLRVYNTLTDPGEQRPGTMFGATSEQQAAVARFCFDEFGAGDEALADSLGGPMTIQMDPATRDALKGLGYLGQ